MGACTSKPKTTETDGSMEPLKKTEDVSADRDIDTVVGPQASERSLQNLMGEPVTEEISAKSEEEAVNVSTEAIEEKCELIAGKEEPGKSGLSSSTEGDGVAQKDDVGDKEEAKDKASSVGEGVSGGTIDGDNICKDKAIVLNEGGDDVINKGDVDMDKAVLDEERAHESLDKGCITTHDNESGNVQEPQCAESPIIGVVQSVHVDDVLESVGVAMASDDSTTSLAAEKVNDDLAKIERDVSTGTSSREDDFAAAKEKVNLSPDLPQDTESALEVSVSTIDAAQPTENEDETSLLGALEDTAKSVTATDPQREVEEIITPEPQGEAAADAESMGESHVKVTENEGNVRTLDELETRAPKSLEDIDAEISPPKVDSIPEEVAEEMDEVIVDEPNVLPQAFAMEESVEDRKPEATSDETIAESSVETEWKEKVEELQAVEESLAVEGTLAEAKVESVDTDNLASSAEKVKSALGEGELSFEDASDVPLKDASNG